MGSFSLVHWIIVALVVLVLFGRGRISEMMGDFGKGIRSFRKGLTDEEEEQAKKLEQFGAQKAEAETAERTTQK